MIRQRTLDKCEEQITSELNIDKLLKKVRDSHAMVTNLPQAQDFRPYLIYNKTNVVQLTDSGDESEVIEEKINAEVQNYQMWKTKKETVMSSWAIAMTTTISMIPETQADLIGAWRTADIRMTTFWQSKGHWCKDYLSTSKKKSN